MQAGRLRSQWRRDAAKMLWHVPFARPPASAAARIKPRLVVKPRVVVDRDATASTGARKLITRLQREVTFEEIVTLGDAPVFEDVAGRHLGRGRAQPRERLVEFAGQPRRLCFAVEQPAHQTIQFEIVFRRQGMGICIGSCCINDI